MARFNYRKLKPDKQRDLLNDLSEIVASFKTPKEARFFLERILTPSEIVMLMRRFEVAELLVGGRTYEQIMRKLGVGTSTIRGVDRWLTDAAYEYQLIREAKQDELRRQKAKERQEKMPEYDEGGYGSLSHLLRRDSRFILFRLLLGDF